MSEGVHTFCKDAIPRRTVHQLLKRPVREICRRASVRAAHREVRGYSTAGGRFPCATHQVSLFFSKLEDKLVFDFVTGLTHFPLNLIQRCQRQDCGGYFLKGTKKKKRFCSRRCAWIMASRERWRSQPEVEKKKRREYNRRKMRIEQPGKNRTKKSNLVTSILLQP